jgi:hypothetical protein
MIQVPAWDGNPNHAFPSVTALIDFRGPDIGDFVFHCHILNHEDLGMMNIIRVQLPTAANKASGETRAAASHLKQSAPASSPSSAEASLHALEIADRVVEPAVENKVVAPALAGHHH